MSIFFCRTVLNTRDTRFHRKTTNQFDNLWKVRIEYDDYDIIGELVRHKVRCQNLSWALGSSWDARQICQGVLPRTLLRAQLGAMELASQAERLAPQTDEQKNWADLGVLHKKSVPSEQTHRNIY